MSREAKIREIVMRYAKKGEVPGADDSLFDSGVLDSFALPDMVSAIEREFGVTIPDSDLNPRKFDSITRIDAYLAAKR
jgi:acyl carrier protein